MFNLNIWNEAIYKDFNVAGSCLQLLEIPTPNFSGKKFLFATLIGEKSMMKSFWSEIMTILDLRRDFCGGMCREFFGMIRMWIDDFVGG